MYAWRQNLAKCPGIPQRKQRPERMSIRELFDSGQSLALQRCIQSVPSSTNAQVFGKQHKVHLLRLSVALWQF